MNLKDFKKLPDGTILLHEGRNFVKKDKNYIIYSDGTKEKMVRAIKDYFEKPYLLDGKPLRQTELDTNADYFAVIEEVDGFGNDDYVSFTSKSLKKCCDYIDKNCDEDRHAAIVGQYFDKEFGHYW